IVPKKLWQRVAAEWTRRGGPEEFAEENTLAVSTALTWRKNRTLSSMLTADFRQSDAQVTPGIPEYRPAGATRIVGPYLPLAYFNANGPDAGVRRRSAVVGLQFDSQPSKNLALRASIEGWWRDVEQDRFTTSVLSLATGLFEGIREPRHVEQPQQAVALQLEATGRYRIGHTDHKLLASASQTWGVYDREERALTTDERNNLPPTVLRFDPFQPDYYRPPFSAAVYSRILTDRTEDARYTSAEVSDRVALQRGIWVLTGGLRYDAVDLSVEDRKPNAPFPSLSDTTQQISYHAGLNYQVVRNRLLFFTSASTAFDPSTRVDARTGRIQPNETTRGYEAGLKGRTADSKWEGNGAVFLLYNQNISRRNPLYDDPIADIAQTQPQLVAAGEERYTGVRFDGRWVPTKAVTMGLKIVYMDAITTASPALPWEVGKAITRLPALTGSLQLRYRSQVPTGGPTAGIAMQYVSNYVANYQDGVHGYLEYPDYALLSLSAGYVWKTKTRTIETELAVRNALDRDLLASNARVGAPREFVVSARMYF
ncbi:MAG TPA: TonB-dependent receptor, partial [Candidatus Didemnitutus sp.]|nr:TonB-dependent receptor [Candidatus Didemnitutus sp.]